MVFFCDSSLSHCLLPKGTEHSDQSRDLKAEVLPCLLGSPIVVNVAGLFCAILDRRHLNCCAGLGFYRTRIARLLYQ